MGGKSGSNGVLGSSNTIHNSNTYGWGGGGTIWGCFGRWPDLTQYIIPILERGWWSVLVDNNVTAERKHTYNT